MPNPAAAAAAYAMQQMLQQQQQVAMNPKATTGGDVLKLEQFLAGGLQAAPPVNLNLNLQLLQYLTQASTSSPCRHDLVKNPAPPQSSTPSTLL